MFFLHGVPTSWAAPGSNYNYLNHVRTNSNYNRNFYFNRIPRIWNQLPYIDINQSLPVIKATIYNHLWQHFITNFSSDIPCTYHFCCRCSKWYDSGLQLILLLSLSSAVSTGCWQTINATLICIYNCNCSYVSVCCIVVKALIIIIIIIGLGLVYHSPSFVQLCCVCVAVAPSGEV